MKSRYSYFSVNPASEDKLKKEFKYYDDIIQNFEKDKFHYDHMLPSQRAHYYQKRGACNIQLNNSKAAEEDYKKAIKNSEMEWQYPDYLSYVQLGNLYYEQNRKEEAMGLYNKVINWRPDDKHHLAAALNSRGYASYENGNLDAALNDFNQAIELFPKCFPQFNLNRANVLFDMGQYEASLEDYRLGILIEGGLKFDLGEKKETVFNAIKVLPDKIAIPLLKEALDSNQKLGKIFWEKRPWTFSSPSLEKGFLKRIVDEIEKRTNHSISNTHTNNNL